MGGQVGDRHLGVGDDIARVVVLHPAGHDRAVRHRREGPEREGLARGEVAARAEGGVEGTRQGIAGEQAALELVAGRTAADDDVVALNHQVLGGEGAVPRPRG